MNRMTVLLLFGGESSEHDVSISSARNVYAAMDNSKYDIKIGYIDRQGKWWLLDNWQDNLAEHGGVQLAAVPGAQSFLTIPGDNVVPVDVIFPVLHGKNGEDGTVQGLADMSHIPIVGCGVEASALAMDKHATKRLLQAEAIAVVDWLSVSAADLEVSQEKVEAACGPAPWFVKPSRAGSSVGVSKVKSYDELATAVAKALEHDDLVLIEKSVEGRELEVAVLGNPPQHDASGVGEIIPGAEFYDYDDKYAADSNSNIVLNAELPPELAELIRQTAKKAYETIGCRGLARVDFLLGEDGTAYLNEINTLPGFTNISMYPKLWQQRGMRYPELVDRLIQLAVE